MPFHFQSAYRSKGQSVASPVRWYLQVAEPNSLGLAPCGTLRPKPAGEVFACLADTLGHPWERLSHTLPNTEHQREGLRIMHAFPQLSAQPRSLRVSMHLQRRNGGCRSVLGSLE